MRLQQYISEKKKKIEIWQNYEGKWLAAYEDDMDKLDTPDEKILAKGKSRREVGLKVAKLKEDIDEAKIKDKDKYGTKYCKKHKQEYYDYLHQCPICAGEKMKLHKPKKRK